MVTQSLVKQLHDALDRLPLERQERVLAFARELHGQLPAGTPGRELLKFAGTISSDDAEQMRRAIEEGCERIDPNGW